MLARAFSIGRASKKCIRTPPIISEDVVSPFESLLRLGMLDDHLLAIGAEESALAAENTNRNNDSSDADVDPTIPVLA